MADIRTKIQEIYSLEQLSGPENNSFVHNICSPAKLIAAIAFVVTVVSVGRYDFGRLIPFIFYPTIIQALSGTPYRMMMKRVALALPFCVLAGLSNLLLDRRTALYFGAVSVSYGMVSFAVIVFKTYLCVMAVLLLVATTPVAGITAAMRRLKIPAVFCILFEMTYRYIGTLLDEASSLYTAYSLRSNKAKGITIKHMGSLVGQLMLRSFDRADRVYEAMKCRGYSLRDTVWSKKLTKPMDWAYTVVVCCFCLLFRLFPLYAG